MDKSIFKYVIPCCISLIASQAQCSDRVDISFDHIPIGTNLVGGQFGWYEWLAGVGGNGQQVVISNSGSPSIEGPGSSSFVSEGTNSIESVFTSSDSVLMEWDVELSGSGPSFDRGPTVHLGRDLDEDGVLESADFSPAEAGYEGLVGIKINYDRVRIRYFMLDELGVRHQDSTVIEWIDFSTNETDLHCKVLVQRKSVHEMSLDILLSGQSGEIVQEGLVLDFVGPHRWGEIDGVAVRTDVAGSRVDNISFSVPCSPNPADLDGNGLLNFFDISGFLLFFQLQDPVADFNNDGQFNFFDVSVFLTAFTTGCP